MATNVQPGVCSSRFSSLCGIADGFIQEHAGMQIASHTNPNNLPLDSNGKRGWSYSLCGCCSDCGTCMFPQVYSFEIVEAHLRPQVSPPHAVPALCTLRSIPGLTISPTMDLPIHLVVRPAATVFSPILSLLAWVLPVFCRFVWL